MASKWYRPRTWFKKAEQLSIHNLTPERSVEEKLAGFNLRYRELGVISFDGEKTPGNAGPIVDYKLEHYRLVIRGWQAMMESGIARIGMERNVTWVIGKGLKLQSEPISEIIQNEGIDFNKDKFTKAVESRWNLFRTMKSIDYAGRKNLNEISSDAEKNAAVGGDVLAVLRVIKGQLKVQLIDGYWVQSPMWGSEWWPQALPDGHLIIDGVELNEKREHVAYYVKSFAVDNTIENMLQSFKWERIEVWGKKSGMRMAYLYYGSEFRINTVRGMPIMAPFTEKLANLDLYSAATLKQAQESAKVDYQVVHDKDAKGKAPWAESTARTINGIGPSSNGSNPVTDDGDELLNKAHITGIGTAYNNPPGAEIKMLENKNPLYFKDFNETHRDEFFAGIMLPPNVAMSKYNDSFSASRAAVMDWAHTVVFKREHHKNGFQKPIFDLWLHLEILNGNIQAPGYLIAWRDENEILLEAYRNIRLVGSNVPHIDPVKEVEAARRKLGSAGQHLPLGDLERITEDLGMGDSVENLEQFSKETKKAEELGIKPPATGLQNPAPETAGKKPAKPPGKKPKP